MTAQIGQDGVHTLLNNSLDDSRSQLTEVVDLTATSSVQSLPKSTLDLNLMFVVPPPPNLISLPQHFLTTFQAIQPSLRQCLTANIQKCDQQIAEKQSAGKPPPVLFQETMNAAQLHPCDHPIPHLVHTSSELIHQPPVSTLTLSELQEHHCANLEENQFISLSILPVLVLPNSNCNFRLIDEHEEELLGMQSDDDLLQTLQ